MMKLHACKIELMGFQGPAVKAPGQSSNSSGQGSGTELAAPKLCRQGTMLAFNGCILSRRYLEERPKDTLETSDI